MSPGSNRRGCWGGVDPVTFVTVGTREASPDRPPGMSPFNNFFDSPARRPHSTHQARLTRQGARVSSQGRRATVALETLEAGPFRGTLDLTDFPVFRSGQIELQPDLGGRTWVRVEVWDTAVNGVFTQPIWLAPAPAPAVSGTR